MIDLSKHLIKEKENIKEALRKLNDIPDTLTLFVIDKDEKMLGTLTDGDIRRGFLMGLDLSDPVEKFMFRSFRYLNDLKIDPAEIRKIKEKRVKLLPVLDPERKIKWIVNFNEVINVLPVDAVVMAGGRGERLRPLTDTIPKPLLKVGNKSIIEHNIDHLRKFGIRNFYLTLRYMAEMIEQECGDGKEKGIKINYIRETEPLGTFGSVRLIRDFNYDCVLLMNSDLFTNIDLEGFYQHFMEQEADMSIATVPYTVDIPYAVLNLHEENVEGFSEKPTYTYHSNAGIYLFRRDLIQILPEQKRLNATDIIQILIDRGKKVTRFPIIGYWIDIGKPEDYRKVLEIVKHTHP